MEYFPYVALVLLITIFLFGSGTWLFVAIILSTTAALFFFLGFSLDRIGAIFRAVAWKTTTSWELAAIPLFIWLGEIVFKTDISERLFRGLAPLVSPIPGRLLHTNIVGSAVFSALCGSSVATTATVGKITTRELRERGYERNISAGSLAGAGGLGLLIPPSIIMIVYGLVAEVSVLRLFAAGIVPGLLLALLFMLYIMTMVIIFPSLTPPNKEKFTIRQKLTAFLELWPVIVLIFFVFGALYSGWATPTETAAVGVFGALVITFVTGQFSWKLVRDSGWAAIMTSAMICTLVIAANFLSSAMAFLHLPQELAASVRAFELPPYALIFVLVIFYVSLGCLLDGVSLVVMTTAMVIPIVMDAGFDPIWFGVFLVIMAELATITPPIGFNLFVIQRVSGLGIGRIAVAAAPFFLLMLFFCGLLVIFPGIALWLPTKIYG